MNNEKKYDEVFINSFSLKQSDLDDNLVYESVPEWDSVGHMGMIAN